MLHKFSSLTLLVTMVLFLNCTKLNETFEGDLTGDQVGSSNSAALLQGVYNSLQGPFTGHLTIFPLLELTTDAAIAPTRGPDWDDNGTWRALHQHNWNAGNIHITECFNALNGTVYAATDILRYNPTLQEEAEARFLRALAMYFVFDLFDQVPYREPGESLILPARVRKGMTALDYIVDELKAVEPSLPDDVAYKANKFAAKFLLMKCYLNKGVYKNRPAPPQFDPADMNEVIRWADEIINNGKFKFSENYFDNFAPNNTTKSLENIFTLQNIAGSTPDNFLFLAWLIPLHYSQFGGSNGWTTLSDFYNKFESNDKRRGVNYSIAGFPPNPANRVNVGFLVDQQYHLFTGSPLSDRFGAPLIFTPEVHNIEMGTNLEVTGIRPLKYFPDFPNFFSPDNDFVFFRLPDVLLMKAEAIMRGGTPTDGSSETTLVNEIRTDPSRGASPLTSINLNILLDERGRELWWEGWRRQDLIRFEKFLVPFQEKDYPSDPKYLLFPIPGDQVSFNPYLKQNPGY